jgi:hypothetical protein
VCGEAIRQADSVRTSIESFEECGEVVVLERNDEGNEFLTFRDKFAHKGAIRIAKRGAWPYKFKRLRHIGSVSEPTVVQPAGGADDRKKQGLCRRVRLTVRSGRVVRADRPLILDVFKLQHRLEAVSSCDKAISLLERPRSKIPGVGVKPQLTSRALLSPGQQLRADAAMLTADAHVKLRRRFRGGRDKADKCVGVDGKANDISRKNLGQKVLSLFR